MSLVKNLPTMLLITAMATITIAGISSCKSEPEFVKAPTTSHVQETAPENTSPPHDAAMSEDKPEMMEQPAMPEKPTAVMEPEATIKPDAPEPTQAEREAPATEMPESMEKPDPTMETVGVTDEPYEMGPADGHIEAMELLTEKEIACVTQRLETDEIEQIGMKAEAMPITTMLAIIECGRDNEALQQKVTEESNMVEGGIEGIAASVNEPDFTICMLKGMEPIETTMMDLENDAIDPMESMEQLGSLMMAGALIVSHCAAEHAKEQAKENTERLSCARAIIIPDGDIAATVRTIVESPEELEKRVAAATAECGEFQDDLPKMPAMEDTGTSH